MRVLTSVLVFLIAMVWAAPVAAQEATPSPVACTAPALPPGTPTAMDVALASPEAAAMPAEPPPATPIEAPAGEPADAATSERVIAAVENLVGCLGSGDALGFAALVTPNYLMTEYETDNPYDLELFLDGPLPISLQSADDVQVHDDGRVSADVTTVFAGTQIDRFRAYFVDQDGQLLLDEEQTQPIETADVTVDVRLRDYSFEMSVTTVPAGAVVAFDLVNEGEYPHEFAVVFLPEGVTVDDVLADPALMDQIQFIGGAFTEPGGTGSMALQNLEPGTYTAVCFVDVPEGVPHVMRGMVTEFTVE